MYVNDMQQIKKPLTSGDAGYDAVTKKAVNTGVMLRHSLFITLLAGFYRSDIDRAIIKSSGNRIISTKSRLTLAVSSYVQRQDSFLC